MGGVTAGLRQDEPCTQKWDCASRRQTKNRSCSLFPIRRRKDACHLLHHFGMEMMGMMVRVDDVKRGSMWRLLVLLLGVIFSANAAEKPKSANSEQIISNAPKLIDLGTTIEGEGCATSINDSGQVVGYYSDERGKPDHAFLYTNGKITNWNDWPGHRKAYSSRANSINNKGEFVGSFQIEVEHSVNDIRHAFLYSKRGVKDIGVLLKGIDTDAECINEAGQIVGTAIPANGNWFSFLYSDGKMINLSSFAGDNNHWDSITDPRINNRGQITGIFLVDSVKETPAHAFLFADGKFTILGSLARTNSYSSNYLCGGQAINDLGQIVGDSNSSKGGQAHAFVYSDGKMKDLGTLFKGGSSCACGINNRGQIVGLAYLEEWNSHAFLYSDGKMVDLNVRYASLLVSGASKQTGFICLSEARAINNQGDIVGQGIYWNGDSKKKRPFLLCR